MIRGGRPMAVNEVMEDCRAQLKSTGIEEAPGIQGRFDRLEESIDELDKLVCALRERIGNVLRDEPKSEGDCVEQMPHCSAFAQGLIVLRSRTEATKEKVRDMLGRLEL